MQCNYISLRGQSDAYLYSFIHCWTEVTACYYSGMCVHGFWDETEVHTV